MKRAEVAQGSIQYQDLGTGTPIVFLHGSLGNGHAWRKVAEPLSHKYRCIIPDLPLGGHTFPFEKEADLSPAGIAEILDQFLKVLNLTSVILVGNDTGGAYAQVFAMKHPEKVEKLILSNCEAFEIFPPKQFQSLQKSIKLPGYTYLMAQLFRFKPFLKMNMALGLLSYKLTKEEIHDLYIKSFIENPQVREDFKKVALGWSPKYTQEAARKFAEFQRPVLLLWSLEDKLFPLELAQRLEKSFPDVRLETVKDSLTFIQEDQPQEFVEKLFRFLG